MAKPGVLMTTIFCLTFIVFSQNVPDPGKNSLPLRVARMYGLYAFNKIDKLKYTFNVKFNNKIISRSWLWDLGQSRVTFMQDNTEPFTYQRNGFPDTADKQVRKIDALFINDQYWLLFPLHVAWDKPASLTIEPQKPLPIGTGSAACITIVFPPGGGYTAGDAYDVFIDKSDHVIQWIYRRGNSPVPTRATLWEQNRRVGPLYLSLDRPGADSSFRVWFTKVGVQVKGSSIWQEPE